MSTLEGDSSSTLTLLAWHTAGAAAPISPSDQTLLSYLRQGEKCRAQESQKFQLQTCSNSTAEGEWAGLISQLTNSAGFAISVDKMQWKDRRNQDNASLFLFHFYFFHSYFLSSTWKAEKCLFCSIFKVKWTHLLLHHKHLISGVSSSTQGGLKLSLFHKFPLFAYVQQFWAVSPVNLLSYDICADQALLSD